MKLYAWYQPTLTSDLIQALREKVLVGSWELRRFEKPTPREIFVCKEELRMPDGSHLSVSVASPVHAEDGRVHIGVWADGKTLCHVSAAGAPFPFVVVATGKGGFLELRIADGESHGDTRA